MTDSRTIGGYIASLGWTVKRGRTTGVLLVAPPDEPDVGPQLPPFRVETGDHWVQLVLGPVLGAGEGADDLPLRLLTVNRDLRIAKFALDDRDAVVLCAELPMESLDKEEVTDALLRIVRYFRHYHAFLIGK